MYGSIGAPVIVSLTPPLSLSLWAASELEFHKHVMTLELSPTYAISRPLAYFQELYDERVKFFNIAKDNRKRKGIEYKETDPWIEKMTELLEEMKKKEGVKEGVGGEL